MDSPGVAGRMLAIGSEIDVQVLPEHSARHKEIWREATVAKLAVKPAEKGGEDEKWVKVQYNTYDLDAGQIDLGSEWIRFDSGRICLRGMAKSPPASGGERRIEEIRIDMARDAQFRGALHEAGLHVQDEVGDGNC